MTALVHSPTGLLHLVSACAALILGTWILAARKATKAHKRIGYGYVTSMVVLNVTSFSIYRLFHGFGPFHIAAIISSVTLIAGMVPVVIRSRGWLQLHMSFMYYSVVGLYAAFVSEVVTRIPGVNFGMMVGVGTSLVMFLGVYFFQRKRNVWTNQYS
jgi:uncharacterized membrane protein